MTTTLTEGEIKLIYTEFILIGIIATFMFLYVGAPAIETAIPGTTNIQTQSASSEDASWLGTLITPTLGLPVGVEELLIVSSIFLIPLIIMNAFVAIRIIKDLVSGWV